MQLDNDIDQLIINHLSGTITEDEKRRLDEWIQASAMNKKIFDQLTDRQFLTEELERMRSYEQDDKGWLVIRKELESERKKTRTGYRWYWAAAACIVAISLGFWLLQGESQKGPADPAARQKQVAAQAAKSKVVLPDGSVVILNKGSEISYSPDYGRENRDISLKGEAYFDVAKDKLLPLVVFAGPLRIKALGTAFNIRAYADDSLIETALIKGMVEVSSTEDTSKKVLMHPNEKIAWNRDNAVSKLPAVQPSASASPGDLIVESIKPNPADSTINEIVWLNDKLIFDHEPFYSVAQKMERWYRVKFVFSDEGAEQLFLSGSLEKESLAEALQALSRVTPFEYTIREKTVTIQKKGNPIVN